MDRRQFLFGALAGTALAALPGRALAAATARPFIALDTGYSTVGYAFYVTDRRTVQLVENGRIVKELPHHADDKFTLVYDGARVRYFKNDLPEHLSGWVG